MDGVIMSPILIIVIIVLIGAIVGSKYMKHKFGNSASKEELGQIHAELKELRMSVDKIQEHVADIYIQVSEKETQS